MNRLVLEGLVPSVNHMYRNAYKGKRAIRVLSQEAREWYEETVILASDWRKKNGWKTAGGKVIVRLWFYFPDRRRRDTHNGLKILLDALEDARFYDDDKHALPQVMDYGIDRERPRVEIELERHE
ncbi:RusA family crossover junction endodeoxyribonuclease [Paenibacillus larvae]